MTFNEELKYDALKRMKQRARPDRSPLNEVYMVRSLEHQRYMAYNLQKVQLVWEAIRNSLETSVTTRSFWQRILGR